MGAELLCVPMCIDVSSHCKTRLRLNLTTSGGDPRDLEEFNAEAVRLASSFPERSVRQLVHKLGNSDQRDPTLLGQASTGLASVPWTV
jgi:hypothetical protein